MFDGWISIADDMPVVGQDVLVYSVAAHGYAVGILNFDGQATTWFNSTNGLPFAPRAISHWRSLPPPPQDEPQIGYSGYGPV